MTQRDFVQTFDTGVIGPGEERSIDQRFGDRWVTFNRLGWWASCPFTWTGLYLPWLSGNWIDRVTFGGLPLWGATEPGHDVELPPVEIRPQADIRVVLKNASHVDHGRLILALSGYDSDERNLRVDKHGNVR